MIQNKKEVWSWVFYDWANSSYGFLVLSFLFPLYFKEIVMQNSPNSDFIWGVTISISILLAALLAPFMGAYSDRLKNKKALFIFFSMLAIIGTGSLYFSSPNYVLLTTIMFIITNFSYTAGVILYDSFLVDIINKKNAGWVSGLGWGFGYLGGLVAFGLFYKLFSQGVTSIDYKITYPLVALFFFLFSLPSFIYLRKLPSHEFKEGKLHLMHATFKQVWNTIKNWRNYKNVLIFLIAFYLLNDGLNTIFSFTAVYAKTTIGLNITQIGIAFILLQLIGFPATIFFGWLSDKFGSKKILTFSFIGWMLIVLLLIIGKTATMFYIIACITGIVIGSSQAPARALLSKIVPQNKNCEIFGFNAFASKISATLGPVIFGAISTLSGNQRWALASTLLFFIGGIWVLSYVKEN